MSKKNNWFMKRKLDIRLVAKFVLIT